MANNFRCLRLLLLLMILLIGCESDSRNKVSANVADFKDLVLPDYSISSIRWEVFGTPEHVGGVPGPTDYVTLIAAIHSTAPIQLNAGTIWLVPEAARPWLTPRFRSLFNRYRNTSVKLSSLPRCYPLRGILKKSGRQVDGFGCNEANRSVIYLTLVKYASP